MSRHVEQRHNLRVNVPLTAWIYIRDQPPRLTVTKNVGRHGVFLEIGQDVFGDTRVVDIVISDGVDSESMRTRGWVVHSTESGTGIMLRDMLTPALYRGRRATRETSALRPSLVKSQHVR